MQVIIHIGTEKTGSTSIQRLLSSNRKSLAERGYHLLQCAGQGNSRALASYCMRPDREDDFLRGRMLDTREKRQQFRDELRQDFDREICSLPPQIHSVIISSEHFHSLLLHPDEVAALQELVDEYFDQLKLIVYLRNQADTALSFYATAIRAGHVYELDEFLAGCDENSPYLNYDVFLALWENAFGIDRISAGLFEREALFHGDLLQDFICRIDRALLDALDTAMAYENRSPGHVGQMVGRAVNLAFPRFIDGVGANPLRRRLIDMVWQEFQGGGAGVTASARQAILARFTAANRRVRDRYFPERQELFGPGDHDSADSISLPPNFSRALADILSASHGDAAAVPPRYIDVFRDAALALEDTQPGLAWELMNLAHRMRPAGKLLAGKVEEYRRKLDK